MKHTMLSILTLTLMALALTACGAEGQSPTPDEVSDGGAPPACEPATRLPATGFPDLSCLKLGDAGGSARP